jgi:hypothetical protein
MDLAAKVYWESNFNLEESKDSNALAKSDDDSTSGAAAGAYVSTEADS